MPALVLMPPHVMYYDISLVLLTYAVMARVNFEKLWPILGFIWLFGFTQIASKFIGFSPLFFVVLFTSLLSVRRLGRMTITHNSA